jgi:DMSO/TMAO reductase YedYZ molybdopterin-dependent catalytic subunit
VSTAPVDHIRDVLSDDPLIRPAPLAALGLPTMPTEAHFRRDHFQPPQVDHEPWRLTIEPLRGPALELAPDELTTLPRRELRVVLECAGHRRAEYEPAPRGIAWQTGAVSEAVWAGASLADVLVAAGATTGRYVVLEGADAGPFRGEGRHAFARALPLAKALDADTLLAWEMNGRPLPHGHGAPLRAIVPGWYATDSIKWLRRIAVLDRPFDGPFEAVDYRVAPEPGGPGTRLTRLPVHALLLSHADGRTGGRGTGELRGIAWGGEGGPARVDVSLDGGAWQSATLDAPQSRYARAHWSFAWQAEPGLRTIAVRATDAAGNAQPSVPSWNEGGYANASCQRIRIAVV